MDVALVHAPSQSLFWLWFYFRAHLYKQQLLWFLSSTPLLEFAGKWIQWILGWLMDKLQVIKLLVTNSSQVVACRIRNRCEVRCCVILIKEPPSSLFHTCLKQETQQFLCRSKPAFWNVLCSWFCVQCSGAASELFHVISESSSNSSTRYCDFLLFVCWTLCAEWS